MASVFLPALIAFDQHSGLDDEDRDNPEVFSQKLNYALSYTAEWMKLEYGRIVSESWKPREEQSLRIRKSHQGAYQMPPLGWDNAMRHWNESKRDLGVVQYRNACTAKLQLWRAMTEVHGYLACTPSKRRVLKELVEYGRLFSKDDSQHMAFLLIDDPGTGKSYLAERLAKQLEMRPLQINITQMLTREHLVKEFDKIVTTQAENREEDLLVFVDEINAQILGEHVYDVFLAPLQDGVYVRDGNTFHVDPCFWIFAGTERPKKMNKESKERSPNKASDFESRLTADPYMLNDDNEITDTERRLEFEKLERIEKIYVTAATIGKYFPDVRRISMKALNAIDLVAEKMTARQISHFVTRFRNVQYGMITTDNLPAHWDKSVSREKLRKWNLESRSEEEEDRMVEIESVPEADRG